MGRVKCDHIKRLITLTSDNIKRLSLYLDFTHSEVYNLKKMENSFNMKQWCCWNVTTKWRREIYLEQRFPTGLPRHMWVSLNNSLGTMNYWHRLFLSLNFSSAAKLYFQVVVNKKRLWTTDLYVISFKTRIFSNCNKQEKLWLLPECAELTYDAFHMRRWTKGEGKWILRKLNLRQRHKDLHVRTWRSFEVLYVNTSWHNSPWPNWVNFFIFIFVLCTLLVYIRHVKLKSTQKNCKRATFFLNSDSFSAQNPFYIKTRTQTCQF